MKKTAIALPIILVFLVPSMANAQTTTHYGRDSGINPAGFDLTIYSPNNQTTYAETMLLKFNIAWTSYVFFPFPIGPPLKGDYAYSIDDSPLIIIESNQSTSDRLYVHPQGNFTINPSFSYLLNVSNLANGYHKIAIIVGLHRESDYYINQTTSPVFFSVQNLNPAPTPTMPNMGPTQPPPYFDLHPEFAYLIIMLLVVTAVGLGFWLYLKKRGGDKNP